jgi:NAD+ synthase
MSGGVDSSVVAVLCKAAFPDNTLGLLLPCHSSPKDTEQARLVANKFQITTQLIKLDDVFDTLLRLLPDEGFDPATRKLAQANLKPRLRMTTLYYFANRLNYLVAGGSNKSELSIGYFTKYGDGGVDLMPLGNLVKKEVRELAGYLGVPVEIINQPPSAGLWEGQTDEEEMGMTYQELDDYLTRGKASEEIRRKIAESISRNLHKRAMPPIPPQ